MIFMVMGLFKRGSEALTATGSIDLYEHLGPSAHGLRLAGFLLDKTGRRRGFMGLLEADNFERAKSYLKSSPFYEERAYRVSEALEFAIQVGRLD